MTIDEKMLFVIKKIFNENNLPSDEIIEANKQEILADCKKLFTIEDNKIYFDDECLKEVYQRTFKIIVSSVLRTLNKEGTVDIGVDAEGEFVFSLSNNKE